MACFRIIISFLCSLWAALAIAGDAANLNILGFNSDGNIFAFEQYGVQDGSGFPYAERFYIDTRNDTFLSGTPIRVRLDDETTALHTARSQAKTQAEDITKTLDSSLNMQGATIVASRSITQIGPDTGYMQFLPRRVFPPIDAPIALHLIEKDLPTSALCQQIGGQKGFELLFSSIQVGGLWASLNNDQIVPQSRGCPLAYQLHQAITFYPESGAPLLVVIIAIRSFGFEGPDHRYMAITHHLNG